MINLPLNPVNLSARVEIIDEINFDDIVVENEFTNIPNDKVENLNNMDKSFLINSTQNNIADDNVNLNILNNDDGSSFLSQQNTDKSIF